MFYFKSLFIFSFVYSCMDQYDPRPYWEQFTRERKVSNSEHLKLSDTGERIATVDELKTRVTKAETRAAQLEDAILKIDVRTEVIDERQDELISHIAKELDQHAKVINRQRLAQLEMDTAH